ncbi:MAG: hypothetical protein CMO21_02295 [Thioclava sp.]|nr:hypothetical protein [Thioclava sp.]
MRILIPILGFGPQGGYRVLSELANAWIRLGHNCAFLVPSSSADPYFPTVAKILRCDPKGRIVDTRGDQRGSGLKNIISLFSGLERIGKEYDVVFANHSLTAWPVRWSKVGKAKKFYYIQAYEPNYYPFTRRPIKFALAKMSYLLNLRQISNSSSYKSVGFRPLDIIPPGVDLSIFTPKSSPGSFRSQDSINVGTIGRTEPYKGTATALMAYRHLRKEEPRLRMRVGFGNVAKADDITIVPIKGDSELASFYRSVDILVVSCVGQHGAPHYPLIEAMACGTPVVHTSYYPGKWDNSWEAEDTSVEAVSAAIQKVISAPLEERIARSTTARKYVEKTLGWDPVAQRFLKHFAA